MNEPIQHKYVQIVKVKKLEENQATLSLADGQVLTWPKKLLPPDVKEGQEVRLLLHDKKTDEEERNALAKVLLDQVMNS